MSDPSTKPTLEEKRQSKNLRNRLYYANNKEAIRTKRSQVAPNKDYYQEHREEILKRQRESYKKRIITTRTKELNALLEPPPDDFVKSSILKLLENPERINKYDVNTMRRLVEKSKK
jgi:hypothetical protein